MDCYYYYLPNFLVSPGWVVFLPAGIVLGDCHCSVSQTHIAKISKIAKLFYSIRTEGEKSDVIKCEGAKMQTFGPR
jgi:hypothetical protein